MGLTSDGAPHVIDDARYTDWVAITPMTSNVNSKKVWASTSQASIGQFIVTKKVKYPEALVRLADMYFTDKGAVDFWHGPMQGSPDLLGYDGWFIKDGVMYYKYTEKGNNGWNYTNAYMNPINGYKLGFVPVSKHIERAYNTEPLQDDSKQKWWVESMEKKVKPYLVKSLPSVLYYDSKSLQRKNELTTALDEYVAQMTAKFIVGDESFSNYDKFITQVKKLGAEEYVSIVQKTYDNYLNNLK
jgi:putative aldouronate transport system substrate-binding protein